MQREIELGVIDLKEQLNLKITQLIGSNMDAQEIIVEEKIAQENYFYRDATKKPLLQPSNIEMFDQNEVKIFPKSKNLDCVRIRSLSN